MFDGPIECSLTCFFLIQLNYIIFIHFHSFSFSLFYEGKHSDNDRFFILYHSFMHSSVPTVPFSSILLVLAKFLDASVLARVGNPQLCLFVCACQVSGHITLDSLAQHSLPSPAIAARWPDALEENWRLCDQRFVLRPEQNPCSLAAVAVRCSKMRGFSLIHFDSGLLGRNTTLILNNSHRLSKIIKDGP